MAAGEIDGPDLMIDLAAREFPCQVEAGQLERVPRKGRESRVGEGPAWGAILNRFQRQRQQLEQLGTNGACRVFFLLDRGEGDDPVGLDGHDPAVDTFRQPLRTLGDATGGEVIGDHQRGPRGEGVHHPPIVDTPVPQDEAMGDA